jgi:tRNA-dihydrouridine synthase
MAVEERVEVARKATDVSVNGDIPRMDGAKGLFAFGVVDAVSIRRRTSLSNFYFNRFSPRPAERRFSRR